MRGMHVPWFILASEVEILVCPLLVHARAVCSAHVGGACENQFGAKPTAKEGSWPSWLLYLKALRAGAPVARKPDARTRRSKAGCVLAPPLLESRQA